MVFSNYMRSILTRAFRRSVMQRIGEKAVQQIVLRTRGQYQGVNSLTAETGVRGKALAKLKRSTQRTRRLSKKLNESVTSRGQERSNLSWTGQMLDAITYKLRNRVTAIFSRANTVKVFVKGSGRTDSKLNNAQVAELVQNKGKNRRARPFMNLTAKDQKTLQKIMQKEIIDLIRADRR